MTQHAKLQSRNDLKCMKVQARLENVFGQSLD